MSDSLCISSDTIMLFCTEVDMLRPETGEHLLDQGKIVIRSAVFDQNLDR
jgi:hypothetical protein